MLVSYFLERRESGGALVQAVGVITNIVVLTQVNSYPCTAPRTLLCNC